MPFRTSSSPDAACLLRRASSSMKAIVASLASTVDRSTTGASAGEACHTTSNRLGMPASLRRWASSDELDDAAPGVPRAFRGAPRHPDLRLDHRPSLATARGVRETRDIGLLERLIPEHCRTASLVGDNPITRAGPQYAVRRQIDPAVPHPLHAPREDARLANVHLFGLDHLIVAAHGCSLAPDSSPAPAASAPDHAPTPGAISHSVSEAHARRTARHLDDPHP